MVYAPRRIDQQNNIWGRVQLYDTGGDRSIDPPNERR